MTVTTAVAGIPRAVAGLPRVVAGWARGTVSPGALRGIVPAFSVCAAAWFSAGTRPAAIAGGCVLGAGYLVARVSAQSAGSTASAVAEVAVYAGLAAGAPATQHRAVWALAAGGLLMLAFRELAIACRALARPGPGAGRTARAGHAPGGQFLLIAVVAPVLGVGAALAAGLGWGVLVVVRMALEPGQGATSTGSTGSTESSGSTGSTGSAAATGSARRGPASALAACRDDGPLARQAGRLVRGQVVPLPPVVAGLTATVLLSVEGMRGLPGVLLLAPAAALLLAAPGAGHPHDGRLDWLVPPLLLAGECGYLAALGFAAGVPAQLTLALAGIAALRHLRPAAAGDEGAGRPSRPLAGGRGSGLGWDGRILVTGLAAALGLAMFAYLALTAYLGWLLCWSGLSGRLVAREEERW